MGRKKINSTKVGEDGKVIKAHLPTWKKQHPNALVFDSRLEWGCWMRLKKSGLKFVLKPPKLELIPTQFVRKLVHSSEVKKALQASIRDAVCKADKTMYKRLANKQHNKVLKRTTVLPTTWAPDFFLPELNIYIESKGFANEAFPIKLKLAQHLYNGILEFIVVETMKDMDDLILFLTHNN